MADYLPEHVIVQIMERLPIKSLIRFTSVSKCWRFIILSDPNFAKSQFQQTRSRRVLLCHECEKYLFERTSFPCPDCPEPEFESRDLETPWSTEDNSTDRKVRCAFKKPGDELQSLYSCNGLVCVTLYHRHCMEDLDIYIWNPSTQFFKKLPSSPLQVQRAPSIRCDGFGYLSATGDYKVLISSDSEQHIFSSNTDIWKRIEVPFRLWTKDAGTLSNEALHWIRRDTKMLAFDLTHEKFRTMLQPSGWRTMDMELGDFRGCLCALDCLNRRTGFIDLWVMKEYNVSESWTKLFTLKISDRPVRMLCLRLIMVMETSTVLEKGTFDEEGRDECNLIKSSHEEEKFETQVTIKAPVSRKMMCGYTHMIGYEESLHWVGDHNKKTCPTVLAKKARNASEAGVQNNGEQCNF